MTDAAHASKGSAARVLSRQDAERLVDTVLETMGALDAVLQTETQLLKGGRLREALAEEARKTVLAGEYMKGLEAVKANALALARFAPDAVARLKAAHESFTRTIALNHAVLATAHSVSEGIVRSVASEAAATLPAASGYAPPRSGVSLSATPPAASIAVSRRA